MVAKLVLFTLVLCGGTFSRADKAAELYHIRRFMELSEDGGTLPTVCKSPRIVNYISDNEYGEFASKVVILPTREPNDYFFRHCEGSIIHSRVILTDAQCVYNRSTTDIKVRAGNVQVNRTQVRLVKEIVVHENYDSHNLNYNVALLFLKSRFDCDSYVLSACIPSQKLNYSRCFGLSWDSDPNVVRYIELPMVPRDVCQDNLRKTHLGESFELHKTFLCAGGGQDRNTCTIHFGSSLICLSNAEVNWYHLIGIKAWHIECGVNDVPDLYTSLVELHPWIYRNLRLNYITLPASC